MPRKKTAKAGAVIEAAPVPTAKKICILGTTPSRSLAPFDEPDWQMWTIGPGGSDAPGMRWERLFEPHGPTTWPRGFNRLLKEFEAMNLPEAMTQHVKGLRGLSKDTPTGTLPEGFDGYLKMLSEVQPPKIVYTTEPMPDWPANRVIDKHAMWRKYGKTWFSSSISYALAQALDEGVTDLGIYGIDLESGEEYRSQWIGAKHFIDLARDRGVRVYMPQGCGLLREQAAYPDCYETNLYFAVEAKLIHLNALHDRTKAEFDHVLAEIHRREGALVILGGATDPDQAVKDRMAALEREKVELQHKLSGLGGTLAQVSGERNAFDFVKHRFVIMGDDPSALAA